MTRNIPISGAVVVAAGTVLAPTAAYATTTLPTGAPLGADPTSQTMAGLTAQLVSAVSTLSKLAVNVFSGNLPGLKGPWFSGVYSQMITLGALVAFIALTVTIIRSVVDTSSPAIWKTVAVRLPVIAFAIAATPVLIRTLTAGFTQIAEALIGLFGVHPAAAAASLSAEATSYGSGSGSQLLNVIVLALVMSGLLAWWIVGLGRTVLLYLGAVTVPLVASISLGERGQVLVNKLVDLFLAVIVGVVPMGLSGGLAMALLSGATVTPTALTDTTGAAAKLVLVAILFWIGAVSPFAAFAARPAERALSAAATARANRANHSDSGLRTLRRSSRSVLSTPRRFSVSQAGGAPRSVTVASSSEPSRRPDKRRVALGARNAKDKRPAHITDVDGGRALRPYDTPSEPQIHILGEAKE